MPAAAVTANEEAQLAQTVEMFEVITQTQPLDYQSLEILKEAYLKLGRAKDALSTSKRIASAYFQLGQLSSAILEYESVLQSHPDDPDVKSALAEIESRAISFSAPPVPDSPPATNGAPSTNGRANGAAHTRATGPVDDGRETMRKLFVDGKHLAAAGFEQCWPVPDPSGGLVAPFILTLAERQILPVETSLKIICDRARVGFIPLEKYDVDVEIARGFPREICHSWCVLPFDRMSKTILVATANPFNNQALRELEAAKKHRIVWYMVPPEELVRMIRKICR